MEASVGDEAATAAAAALSPSRREKGLAEEKQGLMQKTPGSQEGNELDSETPLLVQRDSNLKSTEVANAAQAFVKLKSKNKSALWNVAAKTQAKDARQQSDETPQQSVESYVESPVPSITVTEPSFDTNANATKGALEKKAAMAKPHSSIQFSDVVLSTMPSQISSVSSYSAIEMCVYMMDNTGITLILDEGRSITADVVLDIVLDELDIPREFKPCFGIWLSSPLLHLQLRPTHIPYNMAKKWPLLLTKYTLATEEQLETDEPILRLQRNVFLSPSADLKISSPEALRLLFCEAKENVREGLYPLDIGNCFKMAGICAVAQFGSFVEANHSRDFYKEHLSSFFPDWIENSRASMMGCSGHSLIAKLFSRLDRVRDKLSFDLQRAHKHETERISKLLSPDDSIRLFAQNQYMARCYQLPFYGCAFFRAMLYKPPTFFSTLWNIDRDGVAATFPIKIAVSPRGISLLDLSTADDLPGSLIMSIAFSELYWSVAELHDPEDEPGLMSSTSPAVLPSLFLHFPHPGNSYDNTMLQIVSKQAVLIDAYLRTASQMSAYGIGDSRSTPSSEIPAEVLYGSGVRTTTLIKMDKEEEKLLLPPKDGDQCLSWHLNKLKLCIAADFD